MALPAVTINVSVLKDFSVKNFKSYALPNTPFYFKPVWSILEDSLNYSQYQIIWNFGDGTTFIGPSAMHSYSFPGTYNVSATFYNKNGKTSTVTLGNSLSVYNVMPDLLVFDRLTPSLLEGLYLLPAGKKSEPLKIFRYNSWQHDKTLLENNYTINLYASGSKSTFYSPEEYYKGKYSHLRNFFGFIETNTTSPNFLTKIVDKTTTTSVSVYATPTFTEDGEIGFIFKNRPDSTTAFIGTTGSTLEASKFISYVDQTPSPPGKNTLIFIQAHQDSISLQDDFTISRNLNAYLTPSIYGIYNVPWQTQYLKSVFNPAKEISITSNGITIEGDTDITGTYKQEFINSFSIYPLKWTDSNISFCCTFKDSQNFTTKNYSPITNFRFDGKLPTELNSISLSLVEVKTPPYNTQLLQTKNIIEYGYERISDAVFEKNTSVPEYNNSSYFCGQLKTNTAVNAAVISACVLIQDQPVINLGITYGYAGQPGINNLKRFNKKILLDHSSSENLQFEIIGTNTINLNTDQKSSVNVSVLPFGNYRRGQNRVYVTDADNDKIKIYTPDGVLISTIDLKNAYVSTGTNSLPVAVNLLGNLDGSTPASIALDGEGNAWISLYDAVSSFKFDYNTLTITACAVPPFNNRLLNDKDYLNQSGFTGENTLLPACLDTDVDNNIIIGYSHPLSGMIVKYNSSGTYLGHFILPQNTSIQEIVVDVSNNIYAIVKNLQNNLPNPNFVSDYIFKWSPTLELAANFPISIFNAGRMSIDLNQNIYLNNSSSKITRITPSGLVSEISLDISPALLTSTYQQYIGGIACDEEGYLWVLHNQTGKIYFYPVDTFTQLPLSGIFTGDLPDMRLVTDYGSQAQYLVVGDWTGVRWINKYIRTTIPAPRYIFGKSNLFTIIKNKPVVSKINENFDLSTTFKNYVLQESLLNKPELFDNFLGQIVGDSDSLPTSLGKTIYEKIANFVLNKNDITTCELDSLRQLYSLVGKQLLQFNVNYPPGLRRIMNLLSIRQNQLFGSPNTFNKQFSLDSNNKNLGEQINIKDGSFIGGDPIVSYEKFSGKYNIIYNTLVPETDGVVCSVGVPFPLSGINYDWGWNLVTNGATGEEIGQFYNFYKYIPYMPLTSTNNVIDFDNPQTTFTNTQSSYTEWTQYGGTMERIIAKSLYEGLGL